MRTRREVEGHSDSDIATRHTSRSQATTRSSALLTAWLLAAHWSLASILHLAAGENAALQGM
jgi:hypothetical protein